MSRKRPLMTKGQRGGSKGVLHDTQIKEWFKRFESGSTSVESNPPFEGDLGIPKTVISEIISQDLGMSHVVKFGKSSFFAVEDTRRATTKLSASESKQPKLFIEF
ncbi:hypothetical protein V1477_003328 [Vespula maculifrons]|uniref:Uncharacterized protein n=1 Tax=Vespula maculifrons TaxID=7453 RepID=A0ABD2CUB5_VESMC